MKRQHERKHYLKKTYWKNNHLFTDRHEFLNFEDAIKFAKESIDHTIIKIYNDLSNLVYSSDDNTSDLYD